MLYNYTMLLIDSYKYCENIAKENYENFPVGSLLFPKKKRKYIYAIYAFARSADNIADSGKLSEVEKLNQLNELNINLTDIQNGKTNFKNQIFTALADTIKNNNIPIDEFTNLLKAFKQDSVKQKYKNFGELLEYSEISANPIGHLVLYVSGFKYDNELFTLSDNICTALQLINFWQDVSRDLDIGRIYVPSVEMEKYEYTYEYLNNRIENENFRTLIKYLVDETEKLFLKGKAIENHLSGRLKYEIRATYIGGMTILNKIRKNNYNVLGKRVKLNKIDKSLLIIKSLI